MRAELFVSEENHCSQVQRGTFTFAADNGEENKVVNLYPRERDQVFESFGGAVTDAAGYVFSLLDEKQKETVLDWYFSKNQMNYERVRIHMDSCDFSTHLYSAVEDEKDEKLESFSFQDTERYILPFLDAAEKKAGKRLKIMLSAWSPPPFMKTNESRIKGGALKPECRERWAEYLCRYIEEFQKRGYEVERMSIQNEPKAVQPWDSCLYTAEEERDFLREYLHPALARHGLSGIEVFIWDHNKERLYERACAVMDEETEDLAAGAAFHWYSGDHFEALDLVRKRFPKKKLILSESCLEFCKYEKEKEGINAARLAHDMIGNLNHGMCSFYDWNLLLDSQGGPNHVGNFCDAPFLYDKDKKELIERRILRYYWHFAHFIRPGAVRIAHSRYTDFLDVTAWRNPDGKLVCIILNKSHEKQRVVLRIQGMSGETDLMADSISSIVIEEEEK
ncbi:MAG TPA: glucosylceramidase [Candidatus Choladousia intestinigallinarum]|nr:glucosylceramidase [Candidatus Choladousia intestinigallinarum]